MVISFYPNFGWGFLLSESQKKKKTGSRSKVGEKNKKG